MEFFKHMKKSFLSIRNNLKENNYDTILWIVNIVPTLAGFSLKKEKLTFRCSAPFFILHFCLLFYVYGAGSVVYLIGYAQGPGDYIKCFVNISLSIQLWNIGYWFIKGRPLLHAVLAQSKQHDELAKKSTLFRKNHEKLLSVTKYIILVFYIVNYVNAIASYLPSRVTPTNDIGMQPCVGMEPLSSSPNRELCISILLVQELTIMSVALNYQVLILFLISHTAAMYYLMSYEIMTLNEDVKLLQRLEVYEKLKVFTERHILILEVIVKLKSLYSTPLGVNFASNAACIMFFFYMPLEEMITFLPIMMYCFLVFFLYCFLCQKLINAAEAFERAIYSCGWENFEVNETKMIYMMLMLAQKKVELLAADIVPVNIYTFAVTLQSIFKFVTVVKV